MTRNEEYQALLQELETTPAALDGAVERALRRRKRDRRLRLFGVPAGSLAACFAAFVLLVNLFPPFARACGSVPVLRELAQAVAWSPSLSAAVENDYVQPIGQSQTVNGITATIEYVIVDQKQVHIFFTLKGEGYESLSAEMPEFTPRQHCAVLGADFRQEPGTLLHFTLDYQDNDVPEGFTMAFAVTGETGTVAEDALAAPSRSILDEPEWEEPDILASFTFELAFDPTYTAQGELVPVNSTFQLDGQTLTFSDAAPEARDGRTFLPVRAVFEAMGAQVSYDAASGAVTAVRDGTTVTMTLGSTEASVTMDGITTPVVMDVAPYAHDNRTYVPVRFAAQAFGCIVGWDADDRTVILIDTEKLVEDTIAKYDYTLLEKYLAYGQTYSTGIWDMEAAFDAELALGVAPITMDGELTGEVAE